MHSAGPMARLLQMSLHLENILGDFHFNTIKHFYLYIIIRKHRYCYLILNIVYFVNYGLKILTRKHLRL